MIPTQIFTQVEAQLELVGEDEVHHAEFPLSPFGNHKELERFLKQNNINRKIKETIVVGNFPGTHYPELHKHSFDCAIMYLKTPNDSGDLILEDETIKPYPGLIHLCPAGQLHKVGDNNSDDVRISLVMILERESNA